MRPVAGSPERHRLDPSGVPEHALSWDDVKASVSMWANAPDVQVCPLRCWLGNVIQQELGSYRRVQRPVLRQSIWEL